MNINCLREIVNILDTDGKDINYEYDAFVADFDSVTDPAATRSAGIYCVAVNCRLSRATEPRTILDGVSCKF